MGPILLLAGLATLAVGLWRGYVVAREAIGPLVHEGDETRTLIDASRPVYARSRVRLFARRAAVATGWLVIAFYGLFLSTVGLEVAG
jgi:hypothetical protein